MGRGRTVFYANVAAPFIARIIEHTDANLYDKIEALRYDNVVGHHLDNRHIPWRFEDLVDFAERS